MSWDQISCQEREDMVTALGRSCNGFSKESGIGPSRSLTDLDGQYGVPCVLTVWSHRADGTPVLKDERWPDSGRTCEHYRWVDEPCPEDPHGLHHVGCGCDT